MSALVSILIGCGLYAAWRIIRLIPKCWNRIIEEKTKEIFWLYPPPK